MMYTVRICISIITRHSNIMGAYRKEKVEQWYRVNSNTIIKQTIIYKLYNKKDTEWVMSKGNTHNLKNSMNVLDL